MVFLKCVLVYGTCFFFRIWPYILGELLFGGLFLIHAQWGARWFLYGKKMAGYPVLGVFVVLSWIKPPKENNII